MAHDTVNVSGSSAVATDYVVVIVSDAIFVSCRRPGRLDAPEKALFS
jgi:hypothetical protein